MAGGYSSVFDQAMTLHPRHSGESRNPGATASPCRLDPGSRRDDAVASLVPKTPSCEAGRLEGFNQMDQGEQQAFEERLRRQIEAYHESALLYAAVKLGLPDRMGKRRWAPEQLAHELSLSAPHLHRVLRGLCTIGLCEERPNASFALTPFGQSLASGSHSRLAEKVQIVVEQYWQPWAKLVASLETGKPAFEQAFGMSVGDWRRAHAEQGALFDSYVAKETLAQAVPIIEAFDFSGAGTVADIGGGYGGVLAAGPPAHPPPAGL